MTFIFLFALILILSRLANCNHWTTQLRGHSYVATSTTTGPSGTLIGANSTYAPAPASTSPSAISADALPPKYANHGNLVIPVIVLSVSLVIALVIILSLALSSCFRRRGRDAGHVHAEDPLYTQTSGNQRVPEPVILTADVLACLSGGRASSQTPDALPGPHPSGQVPPAREAPHHEANLLPSHPHQERGPSLVSPASIAGEIGQSASQLCSVSGISCDNASTDSPNVPEQEFETPGSVLSLVKFTPGRDERVHPEILVRAAEGTLTKTAVARMVPMKPPRDAVHEGYNPALDEKRPENVKDLLHNYRILFVIDDSGSMCSYWEETRSALLEIADHALKFHSNAVAIRFFNSSSAYSNVKGAHKVINIFRHVSPGGSTPTGAVLKEVLEQQLHLLDTAYQDGSYSTELPLDIIVVTDGVPDLNSPPAPVIEEAANQLKIRKHHPNSIGIQFVQVGNDPGAEPTLLSLRDGNYDMVDTISYNLYKEEGGGKLTGEVLTRIILGGLHPNLRAYWNQCRRRQG